MRYEAISALPETVQNCSKGLYPEGEREPLGREGREGLKRTHCADFYAGLTVSLFLW